MSQELHKIPLTDADVDSFVKELADKTRWNETISAYEDDAGQKFAVLFTGSRSAGKARFAEDIVLPTAKRHRELNRYHDLLTARRLGRITVAEAAELADFESLFQNEPPPPEYAASISTIAEDRKALRESMTRIEELLRKRA